MSNKPKQATPLRIHPDTYAELSAVAKGYAMSITTLANYILRDFLTSGREVVLARPVVPPPAPEKPKPKADWSVWMDDDDEDEPADPDTLEQWR